MTTTRARPASALGAYPRVTVVIATYERPELLLRCVDALLVQT